MLATGSGMTRVTFINVGYGESVFIEEIKAGKRIFAILVDGGNPYDATYGPEYDRHPGQVPVARYLHGLGVETLDLVILTHFHIDHIGGLPQVLREFRCGALWTNYALQDAPPETDAAELSGYRAEARVMAHSLELLYELGLLARREGVVTRLIEANEYGQPLGAGLVADKFSPGAEVYGKMDALVKEYYRAAPENSEDVLLALDRLANRSCAAFRLVCAGGSVLLPADLPALYWNPVLDEGRSIAATILKFAHHGQKDGVSSRLVSAVSPSDVVFCTSEDNPFKCPAPPVFTFFPAGTRFAATGAVPLPPTWKTVEPHAAVVYEIEDGAGARLYLR